MIKEKYIIEIERPKNVSKTQMKEYIKDAVGNWNGQFDIEDERSEINHETIKVRSFKNSP